MRQESLGKENRSARLIYDVLARSTEQFEGAIAVLNIGGMNDDIQQEAQRVDQDVPFATLDLLTRVVA